MYLSLSPGSADLPLDKSHFLTLSSLYLLGQENGPADALRRRFLSSVMMCLAPGVFCSIQSRFSHPWLDLCTTEESISSPLLLSGYLLEDVGGGCPGSSLASRFPLLLCAPPSSPSDGPEGGPGPGRGPSGGPGLVSATLVSLSSLPVCLSQLGAARSSVSPTSASSSPGHT